tara:strand:+ start:130 stop:261 length:132 start_codon:yes stop_codon:yes gene_type:complete
MLKNSSTVCVKNIKSAEKIRPGVPTLCGPLKGFRFGQFFKLKL